MEKKRARTDVSNAWNFDFDDNELDGAEVAAFEYADSRKLDEDLPPGQQTPHESSRGFENGPERSRPPRGLEMDYSETTSMRHGVGFNDFDEDEDDDEVVAQNEVPKTSRVHLSELEADSESEELDSSEGNWNNRGKAKFPERGRKQMNCQTYSDSKDADVDFDTDDDLPVHPKWKSSHVADVKQQRRGRNAMTYGSDDDFGNSGSDDEEMRSRNRGNRRGSNRTEYTNTRGGRSKFNEIKSDRQRDKRGPGSRGRGGMMGDRKGSRGGDFRGCLAKLFLKSLQALRTLKPFQELYKLQFLMSL